MTVMTVRCRLCGRIIAHNVAYWPRNICHRDCQPLWITRHRGTGATTHTNTP